MKCASNGAATRTSWIVRAAAAVVVAGAASAAQAQIFWDSSGPDQNWLTTQNWESSLGGDQQPGFADTAILNNGGTIVINQDGPVAGAFLVGQAADTSISPYNLGLGGTVNFQAGSLVSGSAIPAVDVGVAPLAAGGTAVWNHNGGTLTTGNLFRVGVGTGATGTLNMAGGLMNVGTAGQLDFFLVGDHGNGTLNMTGGEIDSLGLFAIALQPDSVSSATMSAGRIRTEGEFHVGDQGHATMDFTGGTISSNFNSGIGYTTGSVGVLNMGPGTTLEVTQAESDFVVGGFGDSNNARGGTGTLNMTGGTITIADNMTMAINPFSKGFVNQSGGSITIDQLLVGENGDAQYNLSGNGVIDANEIVSVATFIAAVRPQNSSVTQSGSSSVTAGGLLVGERGTAVYTLNSGTIHVLGVARNGGTLPDATFGNLFVGRDGGGANTGDGRLVQNGGAVTVDTNVFLGDFDDSNGVYEISGGTLNVAGNVSIGAALASNAPPDATRTGTQGQALGAKGTLRVRGSASTINIGGNLVANPGDKTRAGTANAATLAYEIDNSGVTQVKVGGVADLDGAKIDMGFMTGATIVPAFNQAFNLLTAASFGATGTGTTQNTGTGTGFALVADDASDWLLRVVSGGNGQILQAVNRVIPGNTNTDMVVNFADLVTLAQNYNAQTTLGRTKGDFNRDGTVNFSDLVTLAQNYNKDYTGQLTQLPQFASASFQADWALAQSLVPEPTTLGLIGGAGMLFVRRRRNASR